MRNAKRIDPRNGVRFTLGSFSWSWLVMILAAQWVAACSSPTDSSTDSPPPPPPEVPLPAPVGPPQFTTDASPFRSRVQWSPDGRTIYYLPSFNRDFIGVAALDLATGQSRILATAPNTGYEVLQMSADGRFLFYASAIVRSSGGYSISRLSTAGGEPEVLVQGASHIFAITPDARLLAWKRYTSSTDSIFVQDLLTGATRHVAASGFPVSISPDHATLLHVHGSGDGMLTTTSLVTGATSTVNGLVRDARWGAQGLELLIPELRRILIMRGSGAPVTLWTAPPENVGLVSVDAATWSPDGTRVAASVSHRRSQLLLIDVASGSATILVDRAGESFGKPLFSADGRSVAVTADLRLYVIRLP